MIQHGRWRLLNSLWEFSGGFSCRLVSEHRCSSQGTAHGSTAGQEDAAFTPLGASLVGRPHMEGSDPHRQGVKGGRNLLVQQAV